jgi:hypothetical protein
VAFSGLTDIVGLLIVIEITDSSSGKKIVVRTNECIVNNTPQNFDVMMKLKSGESKYNYFFFLFSLK